MAAGAAVVPMFQKASRGAQNTVSEALTADLAVVRYQWRPRGKRNKNASPVDLEFHLNPAALGVAAVGAGLSLWLLQLRVGPYTKNRDYGVWMWPDGTYASKIMYMDARGDAPREYRPVYKTVIEYVEWGDGRTHPEEHRVIDYYQWETATWLHKGTNHTKHYGIEQRRGFGMEGIIPGVAEIGSAASIVWKSIFHPFG